MRRLVTTESGGGLALAILVFALLPALCEEILFRGFVLRGLLHRVSPAKAVIWSALIFGAFHFDLYRLLPTAVLGLVLGWVAVTTGSLWPSIVLHAANNAIAVLATNAEVVGWVPWLAEDAVPPVWILAGAFAVGVVALFTIARLGRGRGV
jgi:membrane protease YdiL (CAAX protease family)